MDFVVPFANSFFRVMSGLAHPEKEWRLKLEWEEDDAGREIRMKKDGSTPESS